MQSDNYIYSSDSSSLSERLGAAVYGHKRTRGLQYCRSAYAKYYYYCCTGNYVRCGVRFVVVLNAHCVVVWWCAGSTVGRHVGMLLWLWEWLLYRAVVLIVDKVARRAVRYSICIAQQCERSLWARWTRWLRYSFECISARVFYWWVYTGVW